MSLKERFSYQDDGRLFLNMVFRVCLYFVLLETVKYLNLELKIIPEFAVGLIAIGVLIVTLFPFMIAFFSLGSSSSYVVRGNRHTGRMPISMPLLCLICLAFAISGLVELVRSGFEYHVTIFERTLQVPIISLVICLCIGLVWAAISSYSQSISWDEYEITRSSGWPFNNEKRFLFSKISKDDEVVDNQDGTYSILFEDGKRLKTFIFMGGVDELLERSGRYFPEDD